MALRPLLIERQAETEALTYPPASTHEEFLTAGFYRLYVPRRYGGYEFGLPTYVRVMQEVARGCVNSAWCLGLAADHALQIGSWFEEQAQAEIFGDGDFRCRLGGGADRDRHARGRRLGADRQGRLLLRRSRSRRTTWARR